MDSLENHPIPQDVTHFQFRLIGDMTIKQFGYLGGGLGIAWLLIALPFPLIIKILLVPIFAILGIVLAFVPIEGRPADTMMKAFFKALFIPNQYVFHKTSGNQNISDLTQTIIITAPKTIPSTTPSMKQQMPPAPAAAVGIQPLPHPVFTPATSPITSPAQPPFPAQSIQQIPVTPLIPQPTPHAPDAVPTPAPVPQLLVSNTQPLPSTPSLQQPQIEQPSREQMPVPPSPPAPAVQPPPIMLTPQPGIQTQTPVSTMEQTVPPQVLPSPNIPPQQPLPPAPQPTVVPAAPVQQLATQYETQPAGIPSGQPTSLKIPGVKSLGLPPSIDVPNLITGIVKDSRGNVIPNILIEVKDKDENPVRAFKTNQLGQFASATPLVNGTYTITFEDANSKHKFDTIKLTADGTILPIIEITSIDERENLRKELFG